MGNEIEKRVRKLLSEFEELTVCEAGLKNDDDLTLVGFNSIAIIRLIVFLEDEFEIAFAEEDLDIDNFSTIASIVHFIDNKLKEKQNEGI